MAYKTITELKIRKLALKADGKRVLKARVLLLSPEQAKMWKETFEEFSYEIRRLALK